MDQQPETHPSVQLNGKSVSESHVGGSGKARGERGHTSRSRVSVNQIASITSLNHQELHGHQLKQHITLHRKDVFYSGSLQNIPLYQQNRTGYVTSNMSLSHSLHQAREHKVAPVEEKTGLCNNITSSMKELIDFSLLKDYAFVLFLVSNLFTNFGFNAPFLFIPDRAADYGMSEKQGAMLLSVVGIANTVGRIIFGFLADLKWIKKHRIHLYNTGLVIAGLSTCFSYNESYAGQMAYAVCFGVFIGKFCWHEFTCHSRSCLLNSIAQFHNKYQGESS